ncbi:MAG: hypothetical protein R6U98_04790 [Pirellulaceae bacterium]
MRLFEEAWNEVALQVLMVERFLDTKEKEKPIAEKEAMGAGDTPGTALQERVGNAIENTAPEDFENVLENVVNQYGPSAVQEAVEEHAGLLAERGRKLSTSNWSDVARVHQVAKDLNDTLTEMEEVADVSPGPGDGIATGIGLVRKAVPINELEKRSGDKLTAFENEYEWLNNSFRNVRKARDRLSDGAADFLDDDRQAFTGGPGNGGPGEGPNFDDINLALPNSNPVEKYLGSNPATNLGEIKMPSSDGFGDGAGNINEIQRIPRMQNEPFGGAASGNLEQGQPPGGVDSEPFEQGVFRCLSKAPELNGLILTRAEE